MLTFAPVSLTLEGESHTITTGTIFMKQAFRIQMSEIFSLAWQFIKRNGYTKSEALRVAWRNIKLKKQMAVRIVKFYFVKVDGSIREAYGSLASNIVPQTQGTGRKANDTVQTYFDAERQDWRCYKKANLLSIA